MGAGRVAEATFQERDKRRAGNNGRKKGITGNKEGEIIRAILRRRRRRVLKEMILTRKCRRRWMKRGCSLPGTERSSSGFRARARLRTGVSADLFFEVDIKTAFDKRERLYNVLSMAYEAAGNLASNDNASCIYVDRWCLFLHPRAHVLTKRE